jgi:hypothetical protein
LVPESEEIPRGLDDEAHRRGLKFDIWMDWAQAGVDTQQGALNTNDPKVRDWLVADTPPG